MSGTQLSGAPVPITGHEAALQATVGVQVVSMFLPKRINVKRKAAWFGDGDLGSDKQPNDMSSTDAQVSLSPSAGIRPAQLLLTRWVSGCVLKRQLCASCGWMQAKSWHDLPSCACACAHAAAAADVHGSMDSAAGRARAACLASPVWSQPESCRRC